MTTSENTLNVRLGADTKFPIQGSFEPIKGMDLLLQDIQLLLLTSPGERVNRPKFGAGLRALVWENIDAVVIEGPGIIRSALEKYEPRINVISISADSNDNTGLVTFSISFAVKSTDTKVNLIFPLRTGTDLSFS